MRFPTIDVRADGPVAALYPEQKPKLFTFTQPAPLGGVSAYRSDRGHFHYVSFGMSEVFGFELTIRLPTAQRGVAHPEAPGWPARLLLSFAEHAQKTAKRFELGHYLCFPDAWDEGLTMRCGLVVEDADLGGDYGPYEPRFLQVVGLHEGELSHVSGDGWRDLVAALEASDPWLLTDPARPPVDLPPRALQA